MSLKSFSLSSISSLDINISLININELKKLKDTFPLHNEEDLIRFLILSNNNYTLCYSLYRNHLEWLNNINKPLKINIINCLKSKWSYVYGYDREEHPLLIIRVNRHRRNEFTINDLIMEQLWWFDHLLAAMPRHRSKFTLVIDRTNASNENQDIEFLKAVSSIFQPNFPDRLHRVIIYPTGIMFYGIWSVVQYFLSPSIRERVLPQISTQGCLQYIDEMYLPRTMGGTSDYEPDIDKLQDPPPMMHSVLNYTNFDKKSNLIVNPKQVNSDQIEDYQSISVSVSMNEYDNDDNDNEHNDMYYADSEFEDSLSESTAMYTPESSTGPSQGNTRIGGQMNISNGNYNNMTRLSTFSFHSPRHTEQCPGIMRGWGTKQGHIVRNWKKRFFVLSSNRQVTLLRYYKEQAYEEPFGHFLCGELNLNYYRFEHSTRILKVDENESEKEYACIEFIGSSSLDKNLLLFIEDQNEYEIWISAIETHLEYRSEMKELERNENNQSDIFSSSALSLLKCNIL